MHFAEAHLEREVYFPLAGTGGVDVVLIEPATPDTILQTGYDAGLVILFKGTFCSSEHIGISLDSLRSFGNKTVQPS